MKKFLFLIYLLPLSAFASPCDDLFPNGKEIVIKDAIPLCNSFYVVLYDKTHNAAVISSEITQPKDKHAERTNDFHADSRLKEAPTPSDYNNTGYDRGHLTPAADSDDAKEMSETFLMSNMTPQAPKLNRGAWRLMEVKVRDMNSNYIVTGAVYKYPTKTIGKHQIPVPDSYFKVVYLKNGKTAVFTAANNDDAKIVETTLEDLEKKLDYKFPR